MEVSNQNDKLLQVSACELLRDGRTIRGKLFIFTKRITFCSIFVYTGFMQSKPDPQKHMIEIKMQQIESLQITEQSMHIITTKKISLIFQNFQTFTPEIFQIIRANHELSMNGESEQISEIQSNLQDLDEKDFSSIKLDKKDSSNQILGWPSLRREKSKMSWSEYRKITEPLVEQMLQLKKDHSYGQPSTVLLQDVSVVDVFDMIYTDKSYKPSKYMKLGKKSQLDYQNPFHFVLEGLVGDRNYRSTLWLPAIPQYLTTGKRESVPVQPFTLIDQLPTRTIVMDHPTKLPFFGEVSPQITMTQKLLLVDDKEFWIYVTSEIRGMVYCENYKMKGYYKVVEVKDREFYLETRECVEWKRRLLFVSGQIDQASAKENERIFNTYVSPFFKERNNEVIQLRNDELRKQQQQQNVTQVVSKTKPLQLASNDGTQQQIPQRDNKKEFMELKSEVISLKQTLNQLDLRFNQAISSFKYLCSAQIAILILILILSFI